MDIARFDAFARVLAADGTRRRLIKGLAVLGIGGGIARAPTSRAATREQCEAVLCPQGYGTACNYNRKGECLGCYCIKLDSGGIVGGGLVRSDDGVEAHLSILATRTADPAGTDEFRVVGQIRWVEPAWEGSGLQLESVQVTGYGPTDGVEVGRDVYGWLQASAIDDPVPFFFQTVAAGGAGSGQDTVSLLVGDAVPAERVLGATAVPSGFSYTVQGALVSGDLSIVEFGTEGEAVPGTPVP